MYICMGVAALMLSHILINVGMVAGLMPVTRHPAPLHERRCSSGLVDFFGAGAGQQCPPQKICELTGGPDGDYRMAAELEFFGSR